MNPWFRYYTGAVHDPKVQRLPNREFKAWVNLLCLAAENGGVLPEISDCAYILRFGEVEMTSILEQLSKVGLFDETEAGLKPHNWDGRQYKSDVSTERVKRFRERSLKRPETVSETPPESEQIQNRTEQTQSACAREKDDPWLRLRIEIVAASEKFNSPAALASAHLVDQWRAQNLPLDLCRSVALPGIERKPDKGLPYWGEVIRREAMKVLPAPAKIETQAEREAEWEKVIRRLDRERDRPYRTPKIIPLDFVKRVQDKIDAEKSNGQIPDIPDFLQRTRGAA